ncbi:MAG: phospholipase A [Tannerella sp.]|jgi:phospholipase A1|nr:phospholipase A [Tannerella sp.]
MKPGKFIFIVLSVFAVYTSIIAQTDDAKKRWEAQIDTNRVNPLKPEYLQLDKDIVLEQFNKQPNFGMYKDNYFITGIPTNKAITHQTADAKFQISIRQRLFNTIMPFNTQLMLIYTQKSFWDIYDESSPFADNNYNPGLLLIKPIMDKNRLKGMATLSFEHESNGKDSLDSRSWNYFTLSGVYFYNASFSVQAKVWYGWLDGENPGLFDYRGYGLLALNYRSFNDKFGASLVMNPCKKALNTQLELTFRPNKNANQYFFLQWYQGYGESLLEYDRYTSMVRVGICMRPPMRNLY